jgi:hypothetical protein
MSGPAPAPAMNVKKPGWVTSVGVLGIVFGLFGILGSVQGMFVDRLLAQQRRMLEQVAAQPGPVTEFARRLLESLTDVPAWFRTWSTAAAATGLLLYAAYIHAAVSLLKVRPGAVRRFSVASALVIALSLAQAAAAWAAMPGMRLFVVPGVVFGLAVYAALLGVALSGDRSIFERAAGAPPPVPPPMSSPGPPAVPPPGSPAAGRG